MTMDLDLLVYVGFVTGLPLNVMGELKLSIGMDLTDCWDELSRVSAASTLFFAVAPPSSDRDSYVAAVPDASAIGSASIASIGGAGGVPKETLGLARLYT
ncbi:hypothetical protein SUGI_1227310 [Cryptomeria japonica]|uniref:Uncharacterized protein n=1 Tax=Cryptomeria japonica TaxID=3369 RepID=A0AAD3RPU5_CRYJA|nr:hypothetical protein SUGI_1227310 [Cryptomeria japonica]